jgi:hypothetical protein
LSHHNCTEAHIHCCISPIAILNFYISHNPENSPEDSLHPPGEVRKILDDYIATHSLVHPREKKYIVLDAVLRACLQRKSDPKDLEFLSRQEAHERLQSGMQPWHEISVHGAETPTVRYESDRETRATSGACDLTLENRKGPVPVVRVDLKRRQQKRIVTVITGAFLVEFFLERIHTLKLKEPPPFQPWVTPGLEAFFLSAGPIADELQSLCASSATSESRTFPCHRFLDLSISGLYFS